VLRSILFARYRDKEVVGLYIAFASRRYMVTMACVRIAPSPDLKQGVLP
jgi:hypothetical protein